MALNTTTLLLPELFVITCTSAALFIILIISRSIGKKFNYQVLLHDFAWAIIFAVYLIYAYMFTISALYTPITYVAAPIGLHQNNTIFIIRICLLVLFLFYFIYLKFVAPLPPNFYPILFCSFLSLNLLIRSYDFLNIFIFMEFYNLTAYCLIVTYKNYYDSVVSVFRYFFYSTAASASMLLGLLFLYLSTGCTNLLDIFMLSADYTFPNKVTIVYSLGALLLGFSFIFKLGLGPLYFWVVEVYSGVHYPVLLFFLTFPKLVFFYILVFIAYQLNLLYLFSFIKLFIAISLIMGICGALTSTKTKDFIIYTSLISHSFFFLPLCATETEILVVFLFFIFGYLLNSMVLVMILSTLRVSPNKAELSDLSALAYLKICYPLAWWLLVLNIMAVGALPTTTLFIIKLGFFYQFINLQSLLGTVLLLFSTAYYFAYVRLLRILLFGTKQWPPVLFYPLSTKLILLIILTLFLNLFGPLFSYTLFSLFVNLLLA